MSLWALVVVASVALLCAAVVAVVWLRQREAKLIRDEQRDERERGAVPRLAARIEAAEEAMKLLDAKVATLRENVRR